MLGEELGDGLGRRGRLEQAGRAAAHRAGVIDDAEQGLARALAGETQA